jgi:hypothetical protein
MSLRPTICSRTYRVATDALRPLPLQSSPLAQDWLGRGQARTIKEVVLDVLSKHGIQAPATFDDLGPKEDFTFSGWEMMEPSEKDKDFVNIANRHRPGKPDPVCATIFIESDWDSSPSNLSSQTWPKAVDEIYSALAHMDGLIPSLEIEIIATHLTRPVHVHPIRSDDELEKAWNEHLLKEVKDVLDKFSATQNMVNGLDISCFGFSYKEEKNPITVYIAVDRRSDETRWSEVIDALQFPLSTVHHQIEVWIEHNDWEFPVFGLHADQPSRDARWRHRGKDGYGKKVNLGDEIGMGFHSPCVDDRTRPSGFGTVGCYVKVKKGGNWRTFALTNYHVVRPLFDGFELDLVEESQSASKVTRQGTALHTADHEGLKTEQGRRPPAVEHPARTTHLRILGYLENCIDQEKTKRLEGPIQKRLEAQYQVKKRFFDEDRHKFGRLWAASGFMRRSAAGHHMDWALIAPAANRIGANSLPSKATWRQSNRGCLEPPTPDTHTHLRGPSPEATLGRTKGNTIMLKMGANSGPTTAQYSNCKGSLGEARYVGDKRQTDEHLFVSCEAIDSRDRLSLATAGDSGAVVYNDEGKVVGLVSRGLAPQQSPKGSKTFPYPYVTPIEDVFADIKAFTGVDDIKAFLLFSSPLRSSSSSFLSRLVLDLLRPIPLTDIGFSGANERHVACLWCPGSTFLFPVLSFPTGPA